MRSNTTPRPSTRRGFTLIELLVAAALCVVVMYVLALAFKTGTDTLSQLKSVAGLSDDLRSAEAIIKRDLMPYPGRPGFGHLEDTSENGIPISALNGKDTRYVCPWNSPNRGYFKVVQGSQGTSEGSDGNNISSFRATDHQFQFTVKLTGRTIQDAFTGLAQHPTQAATGLATNPASLMDLDSTGTLFVSKWGEVTYFLATSTATMPADGSVPSPQPLWILCRRARVLAPPGTVVAATSGAALTPYYYPELAGKPGSTWQLYTPEELASGTGRFAAFQSSRLTVTNCDSMFQGSDILLANVVSMRVQMLDTNFQYVDVGSTWPATYDTGVANTNRFLGIQIQLRVYDTKNMLTRQVTIASPL